MNMGAIGKVAHAVARFHRGVSSKMISNKRSGANALEASSQASITQPDGAQPAAAQPNEPTISMTAPTTSDLADQVRCHTMP